jgi:hypothetical protein
MSIFAEKAEYEADCYEADDEALQDMLAVMQGRDAIWARMQEIQARFDSDKCFTRRGRFNGTRKDDETMTRLSALQGALLACKE